MDRHPPPPLPPLPALHSAPSDTAQPRRTTRWSKTPLPPDTPPPGATTSAFRRKACAALANAQKRFEDTTAAYDKANAEAIATTEALTKADRDLANPN